MSRSKPTLVFRLAFDVWRLGTNMGLLCIVSPRISFLVFGFWLSAAHCLLPASQILPFFHSPTLPLPHSPLQRYEYTQLLMGVKTRIVLYAPDEATAKRACRAAFDRIGDLEDIMSDYRPTSELMRLCDRAGGAPVKVSKELFFVLERAVKLSERTEGAFDVTVGPFVKLWRQARKTGQLPSEEKLRRARALVGWRKIRLDPKARTVQLLVPGMKLDLGGIAKGYAGDCAIAVLKQHRIKHALIELGGDIVVSKAPPSSQGWRIELAGEPPGSKMRLLTLADAAVSTSGDTAQFVEIGGRRYSHIIDPRTGLGLTNRIAATVIARDGITSDPLATAACVLGEEKMRDLTKFYPGVKFYIRTAGE